MTSVSISTTPLTRHGSSGYLVLLSEVRIHTSSASVVRVCQCEFTAMCCALKYNIFYKSIILDQHLSIATGKVEFSLLATSRIRWIKWWAINLVVYFVISWYSWITHLDECRISENNSLFRNVSSIYQTRFYKIKKSDWRFLYSAYLHVS